MPKTLKRFIETYRGSSFPTRIETEDGEICVLKMRGAGNGAESMLSEYVVNRIAFLAGLPVPNAFIVEIPTNFPWSFGTDEFYDLVQKSSGPNLGLAWIEGGKPIARPDHDALPHESVSQIVTLDLIFSNCDRTAQSGNLLRDHQGKIWIVDHGSCRAFFQPPRASAKTLPASHIFAGQEAAFDPHWLKGISSLQLNEIIEALPDTWLTETHLNRFLLAKNIAAHLALIPYTFNPTP